MVILMFANTSSQNEAKYYLESLKKSCNKIVKCSKISYNVAKYASQAKPKPPRTQVSW